MLKNKPLETFLTPLGYLGIGSHPFERVKRELNASGDVL
jgi:hypothetical protein